jgi:hypothetical protein
MKIELNIMNFNTLIDRYNYSLEGFYHNDKEVKNNNKLRKLTQLIALTSEWEESNYDFIDNGFIVIVNIGKINQKFVFSNSKVPNNFMNFIYEMKNLTLEGK